MHAQTTIPSMLLGRLVRGRTAADMLLVIGASLLIAAAAQVSIPLPFTPVPLTLQPLAVILIGAALGSTRGAAAAALYLLEGFGGLPVFSNGLGGPAVLMGATAGYLLAFPAAAWTAGWISERGLQQNVVRSIVGMVAAMAVIYVGGWSWLAALTDARSAFAAGVAPFVLADIVKVGIAAALLPKAEKLISRF